MNTLTMQKMKHRGVVVTEKKKYQQRIKLSLADVKTGRVHRFDNVDELLKLIEK